MGAEMSVEAIETRRNYQREYRRKNREKINSKRREWNIRNQERVREYQKRYWEKLARASEG